MMRLTCLSALSMLAAAPVLAQAALPGSVEPGLIERRFEPPEQPLSGGEGVSTPEKKGAVAPAGAEAATFTLRGLMIEGATAFPTSKFLPLYERLLGTEVSVKTLYDVATAITAQYTAAGYVLSQAVVPPQKIGSNGIAQLRVIEGYVDKVIIQGEVKGPESLLRAYGDKISSEHPLRLETLERYLLLASDLPGAAASGTLKPSATAPGAADLVFEIKHKSIDAVASLDNRGSRYVGPWQATTGLNLNSTLGLYERSSLMFASTPFQAEEMKYVRVSHEENLGDDGTKVSADFGIVAAHPGYTLKEAAVRSHSAVVGLGASHPLIRSRAENLTLRARAEARNIRTDQNVDTLIAKDATRVLRLGGSYDWVDSWIAAPAVSLISLEVSQGFDVLGARSTGADNLSVVNGHSDFLKITLEASRTQRLYDSFSLLLGVSGQWAASPLLSSEQYALGGSLYGRGYDPAEVTGDHGIAGKLELRYAGPEVNVARDWQLYGFWDGGRTWLANPTAGTQNARDLASAGVGIRANLDDRVAINAELAVPLTHTVASVGADNGKDVRGYLGLALRY